MPELPEVETTIQGLREKVLKRTFVDVWTDTPKLIKKPENFEYFKKELKGKKIKNIRRRGKNILFDLLENQVLLIHQKLTGHLLFGKWKKKGKRWESPSGPLSEKINTYIHLLFTLDNGQMIALSDLRKFAKVELWEKESLKAELNQLGPEPLDKEFTFEKFKEVLQRKKGRIKQVLMDQGVIAGIGNIYSDEILFAAKIHPFKRVEELEAKELNEIYKKMRNILRRAIKLQGESISDYRTPTGEKGKFDRARKVYRREREKCPRCGNVIKRIKIGGRSARFCPKCQKNDNFSLRPRYI